MKGFVVGATLASLIWGGLFYWREQQRLAENAVPTPQADSIGEEAGKDRSAKRRRRRRVRPVRAGAAGDNNGSDVGAGAEEEFVEDEPEPLELTAADKRLASRGENLSSPDVLNLDMTQDDGAAPLTQEEIDLRFQPQQGEILACVQSSRPDDITYIPGRVTVQFRIRRGGDVRGVRVEAPAILQRGGIYDCIRKVVERLRFRPSGGSQVVSYPYRLS